MGEHALLSASSSHRWLLCTPSAVLERSREDKSSNAAAEGTAAHELSEHKLREFLKIKTIRPVSKYDSSELEYYTDAYVGFACELISEAYARSSDPVILVEQRVDFSHFVPEGFGTADLMAVSDKKMEILDLKYGKGVQVSADDNPQLRLYALGALAMYDYLYDIESVRMTICQPRLDNYSSCEMSVSELLHWAENELKPKAQLAIKGEGEFCTGEHCRFCKVRATCRARADRNFELIKLDFQKPALLTDEELIEVLSRVDELKRWASDVWAYAEEEAIAGRKCWDGYKVVQGRSSRKYTDEAAIAEAAIAAGFKEEDIYSVSLLGITAMEALMGKKLFNETLGDLIAKPEGKPTFVVGTDKRKEYNAAMEAFGE
ncbi:DUF2800 domain-containing protein [Desulfosporosinus sp. Sb-LF]|uniref:DUF2800 domain-containing protein n=1 Tax=Desulfosporosinus sp. Sb-LF TaxID=2560027 RepID=UPI00107EF08A|nr:DUF2800 domain-containing protein [Desulfosporosinus sp. Sb-LF]TGE33351.1 DUF2800 domain-containing protein [Desulfosporosinus sp. Sb-LF]